MDLILGYISINTALIAFAMLLMLSLLASNISGRLGVPALLAFLVIGMLAGSEGPGGIYFDDPWLAQTLGVVALIFILFAGGLDTNWQSIKPVFAIGMVLSTVGVLLTAVILAFFVMYAAGFTFKEALLLGAIVSSTDAAAVFAVLRSRRVSLKEPLKPLLEFESGSNDPMAVFLTVIFTGVVATGQSFGINFVLMFFQQMGLGALTGYFAGKGLIWLLKRVNFEYEGLYPVLTIAAISMLYGMTAYVGGSGFLAVYMAGLILGKEDFARKRTLTHFHEGIAWLMQIAMFLTLGLLVFPSQLIQITVIGLLISLVLIFVARPVSVFVSLIFNKIGFKEKVLISWVGLRGAVPVILATFPLLADVGKAHTIFNIVFFVVLTSTLIQGPSIPYMAKWLRLDAPHVEKPRMPIELERSEKMQSDLLDILIPKGSAVIGKQLKEIDMPEGALIILINRNDQFFVPAGSTVLHEADMLLALADKNAAQELNEIIDKIIT